MPSALLTIRRGHEVISLHDRTLAEQYLAGQFTPAAPAATVDPDIDARLQAVQTALQAQKLLGTGHLQAMERVPGLPTDTRSTIRRIRRKRNRALHEGFDDVSAASPGDLSDVVALHDACRAFAFARGISSADEADTDKGKACAI